MNAAFSKSTRYRGYSKYDRSLFDRSYLYKVKSYNFLCGEGAPPPLTSLAGAPLQTPCFYFYSGIICHLEIGKTKTKNIERLISAQSVNTYKCCTFKAQNCYKNT